MAYRVSRIALERAIKHLCRYGDTDIFPHLPELAFFADERRAILDELTKLDLDSYSPGGAIEALAPKSRFGFRISHQMSAVDSLLFLACVIELGASIEKQRPDVSNIEAFSYRFCSNEDGELFHDNRTYKDWLNAQKRYIRVNRKIRTVVFSDISDFYARINFHRLENLLDECAPRHGAGRFIKKQIKVIRAKQSFGLPVGGSAARLLAELALADTDRALADQGLAATRFVDDFRIFLSTNESPYDALGFLAEQLGINEGLSLNAFKTKVLTRKEFLDLIKRETTDVTEEAEGVALAVLTANVYFDDSPDEEDLRKLQSINLLQFLEDAIKSEPWDVGHIRVIFRALRVTKPFDAIEFITKNFGDLTVFAKEICILMQALEDEHQGCFDDLLDEIIDAILRPPASSVQVIRTWLLEIFVRGIIKTPLNKLKKLEALPSFVDKRQILLIRGRHANKNYFRKHKTAVDQFSQFEQPCLVWGASCLPKDEFENWIATISPKFSAPTGRLFLNWAMAQKPNLVAKLSVGIDDHPD